MTYQIALIIQCWSIIVLLLESAYIFYNWKTRGQSYLFIFCLATLVNNVAYLFVMLSQSSDVSLLAAKFSYLGKVWIPISFFAMIMEMCEFKINKRVYGVFIAIHLAIMILVLTNDYHHLYYTSCRFDYNGLFPRNIYGHGWIYNLYMAFIFGYIIFGTIILIRRFIIEKDRESRKLYAYLFIAIITMSGGLVAYILKLTNGYDATAFGYAVSSVVLFVAIFKYNLLDTLSFVRDYVVDTLEEGIIATDKKGNVLYYNTTMHEIYWDVDYEPEVIVERIEEKIHNHDVIRMDGKVYEPVCKPLYRGTSLQGELYVLTNVTARYKHMEELQKQKTIAEEANASKSAFLSVVTHEIRTPMNAIVGMTELILRDQEGLDSKHVKYLKNIKNSGDALVMIVNDILDQSKIEAGKMEIVEDVYEIRPMTEDVKMIIENRIGSKPIHLIYDIKEDVPKYLIGDSLRIRQILINLMNNAVKFTSEGYIRLGISCEDTDKGKKMIHFSVKDSGQGIKEEDLSRLGQAFTQVDTKKNHSKEGTGLGLSISRDFISMMGGTLNVTSEYGVGTEFSFSIWQGVASSVELSRNSISGKQAWQEVELYKAPNARILIVDDVELNLMITSELLQPIGMTIDIAASGKKAIELIKQNRYHVVFMDYMMPVMNGVQTTENIRALATDTDDDELKEYYRTLPIIALSGDDSEETKEKFRCAGIDDFTVKPVDPKKLKKVLYKWLPKELVEPAE